MSFTQVRADYEAIIRGDYEDKKSAESVKVQDLEARAERERWYAERRAKAERESEDVMKVFMQNEEFKRIHKRLNELQGEIGRTEAKAEMGDDKAVKQLVKLTQEQSRFTCQYHNMLELNGKTEEDLQPKWHCKKCKDTGWKEDGKACDCYGVE
jgi:DNA replication protein DnaC